jgi:hypothetical protein
MEVDDENNNKEQDSENVNPDEELQMYTPEPADEELDAKADVDTNPVDESPKIPINDDEPVRWSASEYIHVDKNGMWFAIFAVVAVALIAADLFFIKSYTFSVLVVVMAAAIVVHSRRPPQMVDYTLSGNQGLYIGEKLYHFDEFKAFGLIRDGEHHSVMLIPIKRFAPGVSVYFPEEVGEKIVDILGARLPMEDLKLDTIDIIVRKLRL